MNDKVKNYSDEAVAELHAGYDVTAHEDVRTQQVAQLAAKLQKSPASVIAKLTREGLYIPKHKAPAGKAAVSKAELVTQIAKLLNVDEDVIGSLEKATKVVLGHMLRGLQSKE
jgi:hypothetical protein